MVQAFERFRQAAVQAQMAFETLARVLVYLRASLNGAILDTLRTLSRPREVSRPVLGQAGEPGVEDQIDSNEIWEVLQILLPRAREQRLAYLLYHCGLGPREILLTSRTRTVPPCFLSFISVLSQVQLRELNYTCVQYIKTEALATASSKAQRNCEK